MNKHKPEERKPLTLKQMKRMLKAYLSGINDHILTDNSIKNIMSIIDTYKEEKS